MPRAPAKQRPAYHHGDLRRALLDAAVRILDDEGASALTLREVARRVGVTPAAPYHHFADKEAILAALAEEGFVKLNDAMVAARDAAGPKPAARLSAMGMAYVRVAAAHPAHFRVMFNRLVDISRFPTLHTAADRALATLVDEIAEGQRAGALRRGDPMEMAVVAWSTTHGLAMLWVEGALKMSEDEDMSLEPLAKAATDMLVRGLSAGGGSKS